MRLASAHDLGLYVRDRRRRRVPSRARCHDQPAGTPGDPPSHASRRTSTGFPRLTVRVRFPARTFAVSNSDRPGTYAAHSTSLLRMSCTGERAPDYPPFGVGAVPDPTARRDFKLPLFKIHAVDGTHCEVALQPMLTGRILWIGRTLGEDHPRGPRIASGHLTKVFPTPWQPRWSRTVRPSRPAVAAAQPGPRA